MFQILVIDDDRVMRMILKRMLKEQGYETIIAKNGNEGIELAKQYHPALVLCDWVRPCVDGLEVCNQIKKDPDLASTFFILLTARNALKDKVTALDNGVDDFLAKPIEKSELIASVRAGLRLYKLNQDLKMQTQLLESELNEASEYIRALLPVSLRGYVNITTQFIPSRQLGGDGYDFYWLDSDHLVIYLIDTSGHGVGSALLSVSILNLLRSQSFGKEKFYDPTVVMTELNRSFQMRQQGGRYFTMWYGVYQRSRRKLVYGSAGHSPALLAIGHDYPQIKELPSLSMPIGFFPDAQYESAELDIPPNTHLYVFSDGIFEVMQANHQVWGLYKFIDFVSSEIDQSCPLNAESVLKSIRQELGNVDFNDDVSLLQIRFN